MQRENELKELRFLAKIADADEFNKDREFSVIFSLVDDGIKVWENKSDGFDGGFVYKPPHDRKRSVPDLKKMYIGSVVPVNGVKYELLSAPECTYETMEKSPSKYPQMDTNVIIPKIVPFKDTLSSEFEKKIIPDTDRVTLDDATDILEKCEANLTKNEVIAIIRRFRFYKTKTFSFNELLLALE